MLPTYNGAIRSQSAGRIPRAGQSFLASLSYGAVAVSILHEFDRESVQFIGITRFEDVLAMKAYGD